MDLATFLLAFEQAPIGWWFTVILFTGLVWFIPSILAIFFNRKHLKFILLANIPAGFSFIAWGACIVWAVTGKMTDKALRKNSSNAGKNFSDQQQIDDKKP